MLAVVFVDFIDWHNTRMIQLRADFQVSPTAYAVHCSKEIDIPVPPASSWLRGFFRPIPILVVGLPICLFVFLTACIAVFTYFGSESETMLELRQELQATAKLEIEQLTPIAIEPAVKESLIPLSKPLRASLPSADQKDLTKLQQLAVGVGKP